MKAKFPLSEAPKNQYYKVVSINFKNQNEIDQFFNIGVYVGSEIFICNFENLKIIHLLVDNIQYAIKECDAKKIIVEEVEKQNV